MIRVVTPGTITSAQALDETRNNYLMGIVYLGECFGIATADISTGDFFVTEVTSERDLYDEINKFSPSEIICNEAFYMSGMNFGNLKEGLGIAITRWIAGILTTGSVRGRFMSISIPVPWKL